MRIQKIEFCNINSLRGEHVIDFTKEPFLHQPLFAITGVTGSGKTSILDAITLALFNQIPRLSKISKSEIIKQSAIITRGEKSAYSRVTYSCMQGLFLSEWSIDSTNKGNLKDYDMAVYDLKTDKAISDKKSKVPALNEDLIGLSYNQFEKSVLLAQGAFGEFLKVNKKDRGALLEKITGTEIYRQLGIKAFHKSKNVNNQIDKIKTVIDSKKVELVEKEVLLEWRSELKTFEKKLINTEAEIIDINKKLDLKKQINELSEQIDTTNKNLNTAKQQKESFELNNGLRLLNYNQVEAFASQLKDWNTIKTNLIEQEKLSQLLQKEIKENDDKATSFISELKEIIPTKSWTSQPIEDLANFERQVLEKESEINQIKNDYQLVRQTIVTELKNIQEVFNHQANDELERLTIEKDKTQQSIEAYYTKYERITLDKIPSFELHLDERLSNLDTAKNLAFKFNQYESQLNKINLQLQTLSKENEQLPDKIEEKNKQLTVFKMQLNDLKMKAVIASLEEHRTHLNHGEPCPLCGALEHPYLENLEIVKPKENEIDNIEVNIQQLQKEVTGFQTTINLSNKQIATLNAEATHIESDKRIIKESFFKNHNDITLSTDFDQLISALKEQKTALNQLKDNLKKVDTIQSVLPKINELNSIRKIGKEQRSALDDLYSNNQPIQDFVKTKENQWNLLQKQTSILKTRQESSEKELAKTKKSKLENQAFLQERISSLSFKTIDEAHQVLLPFEEVKALREEEQSIKGKIQKLQNTLELLTKNLKIQQEIEPKETAEELSQSLIETQEKLTEQRSHRNEIERKIKNFEKVSLEIKELDNQIHTLKEDNKRWYLLSDMIGDATGNKFNTFAQELTLIQLLQLANKRLENLSNRYVLANPEANEDDSLMILDKDMGGLRRSVKTLSGGETFVMSLALALALSDLASNNVQIESLFIDEGFGTLDPETLDQTLDVLERLQEEDDKMIGIISHVSALKERITTQIQVEKNGRGYSTLQLLPKV